MSKQAYKRKVTDQGMEDANMLLALGEVSSEEGGDESDSEEAPIEKQRYRAKDFASETQSPALSVEEFQVEEQPKRAKQRKAYKTPAFLPSDPSSEGDGQQTDEEEAAKTSEELKSEIKKMDSENLTERIAEARE